MAPISPIALYSRFEVSFESAMDYANPVQDIAVEVQFRCEGVRNTVRAFWDGGRTWRVRFSPDRPGRWTWQTASSHEDDLGLHGRTGMFDCVRALSLNPLYARGPIRVSEDHRHFVHADGTPFFWLGDTAWNGPLKSTER